MKCKCGLCNVLVFVLLLVFTIGLNLGIHGTLHMNVTHDHTDFTDSNTDTKTIVPDSSQYNDRIAAGVKAAPLMKDGLSGASNIVIAQTTEQKPDIPVKTTFVSRPAKPLEPSLPAGPIEQFVASGGKFPILLITCNRPDVLKTTLNSLLAVRGVTPSDILVVQDGSMISVTEVVTSRGIRVIQNKQGVGLRGGAASDGASRIASHYKFALTTAFRENPAAPALIVVEDDLLFSPDFSEYFHVASPILDHDETVFALSAWSDNGFLGLVKDPYRLERTDYFPGLGWLVNRQLYESELEPHWPSAHWDHWLRSEGVNRNREIVHPEVPRSYHNGIKGTFMDLSMHNKYFKDIAYNTDPSVYWTEHQKNRGSAIYTDVLRQRYETEMEKLISECINVGTVQELISAKAGSVICAWIDVLHEQATSNPPFSPISNFFGLWHEHRRGAHWGLHKFYWRDKLILLINIKRFSEGMGSYADKRPINAVLLNPRDFDKRLLAGALDAEMINRIVITPAKESGQDCNKVCASTGMTCVSEGFAIVNTCPSLQSHFSCSGGCIESFGLEQPAYVLSSHTENPGACLYTSDPSQSICTAFHAATVRLCPCVKN